MFVRTDSKKNVDSESSDDVKFCFVLWQKNTWLCVKEQHPTICWVSVACFSLMRPLNEGLTRMLVCRFLSFSVPFSNNHSPPLFPRTHWSLAGGRSRCLAQGHLHVEERRHYWHLCSQSVYETVIRRYKRRCCSFFIEHLSGSLLLLLPSRVSKIWNVRRDFFFSCDIPIGQDVTFTGAWSRFDSLMWSILPSIYFSFFSRLI